jgi:hypothetical protein
MGAAVTVFPRSEAAAITAGCRLITNDVTELPAAASGLQDGCLAGRRLSSPLESAAGRGPYYGMRREHREGRPVRVGLEL